VPHATPEARATYQAQYRETHRAEHRAACRDWRERNADKEPAYHREYRRRDIEDTRAKVRAEMARRNGAEGRGVTAEQWQDILAEYGHRCAYCYRALPLEQDHIEPLSAGGLHDPTNVVPACARCNRSKGRRPLVIWLHRLLTPTRRVA
jgi:5-methylcytosine-specific restriction endonuclease McrA